MIYIIFFISITVHEIGHLITSKLFNIKIGKPRLGIFGYSTKEFKKNSLTKPLHKILVFLSGPAFNFILAILIYNLEKFYEISFYMFYTNLLIGIVNLLPILPLDGGNILNCILENKFDFYVSGKMSLLIGKMILVFISLIYCFAIFYLRNMWIFCGIIYLWILFFKEERNFELYLKILNKSKNIKC